MSTPGKSKRNPSEEPSTSVPNKLRTLESYWRAKISVSPHTCQASDITISTAETQLETQPATSAAQTDERTTSGITSKSTQYDADVGTSLDKTRPLTSAFMYSCLRHHYEPNSNDIKLSAQLVTSGSRKGKQLSFQTTWLKEYPWLVYSPSLRGGLCKFCVLFSSNPDRYKQENLGMFVKKPFQNFKKAKGKDGYLHKHQRTSYHQDAVIAASEFLRTFNEPSRRIDHRLTSYEKMQYEKNVKILETITDAILLVGKQCLPLRGHRDDNIDFESIPIKNEGNFIALLRLIASKDSILSEHLRTCGRNQRYTSKTIQNEIIDSIKEVLMKQILKQFSEFPQTPFAVIADEVTDKTANREVLTVCIRFVDEVSSSPQIKEAFLDFVHLERTTGRQIAEEIMKVIKDVGLDPSMIRGQSYDGASSMSSEKMGVQAIIKGIVNERAQYTHCYSHVLNLSICAACKEPVVSNFIGMINEVYLFFSMSPKRQAHFEKIVCIIEPESKVKKIKGLCKTRWVERHECLERFCQLLPSLLACWREIIEPGTILTENTRSTWSWDLETRSKAQGLMSYFEKFSTAVLAIVVRNVLNYARPLTSKLQKSDIDIYQAYQMIDEVINSVEELRTSIDSRFSEWWNEIIQLSSSEPTLPRLTLSQTYRSTLPTCCNPDYCDCAQPKCAKSYFMRSVVLPLIDHLLLEMRTRFENRLSVGMFQLIPDILARQNFVIDEDGLRFWEMDLPAPDMLTVRIYVIFHLIQFVSTFSLNSLQVELGRWIARWKAISQASPKTLLETLREADSDCFPNIRQLLLLGCTLPITSAEAERSFSLFRHMKVGSALVLLQ